ncbi:DNA polymerase III PolC-type-like isoform X1 [Centropristis striata]|uniref:DNA polymerase III PolC-type-like isoform X1 n=1 Tax=Centropristis striata TaxID=184440 RepID=UPI0027DFBA4C|nr:DNA polymerase III PolC-type-like isoform X1 [Centropristis striata]
MEYDDGTIVFFDLETTGLNTDWCHIIQLSAVCDGEVFNEFILPLCPIDEGATRENGFTVHNGYLYRNGNYIPTTGLYRTIKSFIQFLSSFDGPVWLAAHNARWFDAPILARVLRRCHQWWKFQEVVSGFVDTLPLSRFLYPELRSHKQPYLVKHFLGETYDAHDAKEDATMLERLFNYWDPDEDDVEQFTDPTEDY